ncbi:MAG: hypothetical protein ACLSHJ_04050 [Oscillospiraceae bacterium]
MSLTADDLKIGKQAVRQGDLTIRLRGSAKLRTASGKAVSAPRAT